MPFSAEQEEEYATAFEAEARAAIHESIKEFVALRTRATGICGAVLCAAAGRALVGEGILFGAAACGVTDKTGELTEIASRCVAAVADLAGNGKPDR